MNWNYLSVDFYHMNTASIYHKIHDTGNFTDWTAENVRNEIKCSRNKNGSGVVGHASSTNGLEA